MRYAILFILIFISSSAVFTQTKTVTNADLEKYRQARLAAEKEYRENYAQMGFPSPEELKQRNEQQARELSELSARLRTERLENERNEAVRRQSEALQRQSFYYAAPNVSQTYYTPNYLYGFPVYGYYKHGYYYRPYPKNNVQYDNRTRLWSFTELQTRPPRVNLLPQIIRLPRKTPFPTFD